MIDEVKIARFYGGYILTYFNDNARQVRVVCSTMIQTLLAVGDLLAKMDRARLEE